MDYYQYMRRHPEEPELEVYFSLNPHYLEGLEAARRERKLQPDKCVMAQAELRYQAKRKETAYNMRAYFLGAARGWRGA